MSKWDRIIAARAARQTEEIEVEEISALNLIESILEERPGNFKTIFEQLMQDRLQDLVSEAKQYYASLLLSEQEVEDDEVDDGFESYEGEDGDEEEDDEIVEAKKDDDGDYDFGKDDDDDDDDDDDKKDKKSKKKDDDGDKKDKKGAGDKFGNPIPKSSLKKEDEQLDEVRLINRKPEKGGKSSLRGRFALRRRPTNEQHLRGHGTTLPGAPEGGGHLPGPTGPKAYKKTKQPKDLMTKTQLYLRQKSKHTDYTNTEPKENPLGKSSGPGNVYDKTLRRLKSMSKASSNDKV